MDLVSPAASRASRTRIAAVRQEVEAILASDGLEGPLAGMVREALSAPGKILNDEARFRWASVPLLVCEALCGHHERAVPVGAAIELFVAAGDVLDDVQDQDNPGALYVFHGPGKAINAGTALLMLTWRAIHRLRLRWVEDEATVNVSKVFSSSGLTACLGQHQDLEFESRTDVTEDMYLEMTAKKSAALMECACRAGAVLGTRVGDLMEAYATYGHNFGMASQIENDLVSLVHQTGEKSDLARGKKTLPIIFALHHAPKEQGEYLARVFGGQVALAEAEKEVPEILRAVGAIEYSLVVADIHKQRALKALESTGIAHPANEELKSFLHL